MVNPMTTTREEQRDVVERLRARAVFFARLEGMDGVSECGRQEWSAIVAEVRDAADLIDRLRASQAGGVPADVIVAAYKRGWHWNNENEGDDTFLNKSANAYADKVISAASPAATVAGGVPAAFAQMSGIEFRFLDGPWENSELPTIVRDDPDGGDPWILATISRVHHPDQLYELCDRANASPSPALVAGGVPAGWMDMADAPRTRPIIVLTAGGRIIKAKWVIIGDDAVGWGTPDEDDPHPNCWHTGFCWASNEDEEPSDPPVGWIEIPSASPPPPATDGALESEGLVQAAVQGNGSVTLPVCQWKPIETAPKDGTWVLGFRPTSFREDQIDTWQFVHRSCDPPIWINSADSNDEDEQPTHWMPLPPRPDDRTNGSEAQSGSLNHALPASLVSATDAVEAEREKVAFFNVVVCGALQWFEDHRVALQKVGSGTIPQWVLDGWALKAAIRARGTENGEQS